MARKAKRRFLTGAPPVISACRACGSRFTSRYGEKTHVCPAETTASEGDA